MKQNKHSTLKLRQFQALPLEEKINKTKENIHTFHKNTNGNMYISFSGGKDSTVLLHLVRELYPDTVAVFCDTGLEFPEIKEFVKTFPNVEIIRPNISFKEVIEKYGWCFPSKEISCLIESIRAGKLNTLNNLQKKKDSLHSIIKLTSLEKWKHLINSDFLFSDKCCHIMKKQPFERYTRKHKKVKILGNIAQESHLRTQNWLAYGCTHMNGYKSRSTPMAFWKEQDILEYILWKDIQIASIYGNIIRLKDGTLKATGFERTGCVFCPIGVHIETKRNKGHNRFTRLANTHQHLHTYCINTLGLGTLLDYLNIPYQIKNENRLF
jgi:3'-phosphoadenosine 5'-phosphosulfate sulfotransferase (PAPS reductase)/FAD synthetase